MTYTIRITNNETLENKEVTIQDSEILALKNDLIGDVGIFDWVLGAIKGKINSCIKRMRVDWQPILINEEIKIPKTDDDFVSLIIERDDYKNREQREEEGITR